VDRLGDQVEDALFAALLRRYHFLEFDALFDAKEHQRAKHCSFHNRSLDAVL
jgi:hypothetical protein